MTDTTPPAYLDRNEVAWTTLPGEKLSLGLGQPSFPKSEVENDLGPLVPLWPEGQKPQPEGTYVWTQGDDEADLLARLVEGAHATVENSGVTYSGLPTRDDEGWTRLGERGPYLFMREGVPCPTVADADRITVVPPPEPVLPEWATYAGEGWRRILAATPDRAVWWKSGADLWRSWDIDSGSGCITPAELIARGGHLLIDHNGKVVDA